MRVDRLRETRLQRGLSQEDLAKRCEMSLSQIFRIESGRSEPSGDAIARIARALEVSADFLLGLVDQPADHLQLDDYSPMERRLILAVRQGLISEALEVMTTLSKGVDKPRVASE